MTPFFKADLHCHTTHSDGSLSPRELFQLAQQVDLQGISITDHDTVSSYAQAFALAEEQGILCISGAEFSTLYGATSVHILAYAFNVNHPAIASLCHQHIARRQARNQAILERLASLGMLLTLPDCDKDHAIGRPHIAEAMIQAGYAANIPEAFAKYLAEGQPGYVPGEPFGIEQTIDVIHQAGGYAIIAHPHLIKEPIIPHILGFPFDGIEGYYARFTPSKNERWIKIAKQRNWIITGGSDFHGDKKPEIVLGSSWTPEDTFHLLHAQSIANNR